MTLVCIRHTVTDLSKYFFLTCPPPQLLALAAGLISVDSAKTTSVRLESSVWYAPGGLCASSHFLSEVQYTSPAEFGTSRPHPVLHTHLSNPESKQRSLYQLLPPHPSIPYFSPTLHKFISRINFPIWSMGLLKITFFLVSHSSKPFLTCTSRSSSWKAAEAIAITCRSLCTNVSDENVNNLIHE